MSTHHLHYQQQMNNISSTVAHTEKYQQSQGPVYTQYPGQQPHQHAYMKGSVQQQHQQQFHKSQATAVSRPVQKTATKSAKPRQNNGGSNATAPAPAGGGAVMFGFTAEEFVTLLDRLLEQLCHNGNPIPYDPQAQILTSFHQRQAPAVSIKKYLERIMKYAHCSDECYILALIYLGKITQKHKNLYISKYNIHRLLITSVMEAIKFFDDRYYNNSHYARVGGVSCQEINQLETEFLTLMDYELHVPTNEFEFCKRELIQFHNSMRTQSTFPTQQSTTAIGPMSKVAAESPEVSPMSTTSSPVETPVSTASQPSFSTYRSGAFRPYSAAATSHMMAD